MEPMIIPPSIMLVALVGIFVICLFIAAIYFSNKNKIVTIICSILFGAWFAADGWESRTIEIYQKESVRKLVSASPSNTKINGSIDGSFLFFGGVVNESRYYLLREEVEPGLYKDFEVKHEVYIREDANLKDSGKFVQLYKCHKLEGTYDIFGYQPIEPRYITKCKYKRQEIVVPQGFVIKDLTI
ncbi:hypothetical protein [Vibrio phage phiKT1024]|nr:hypothetical protein [Vibrio phage phiKT1024]